VIAEGVNDQLLYNKTINPAESDMFPILSQLASSWEEWRVVSMSIEFISGAAFDITGQVAFTWLEDPSGRVPDNSVEAANSGVSCFAPVTPKGRQIIRIPAGKWLKVHDPSALPAEERQSSHGRFVAYLDGGQISSGTPLGRFEITYRVEFRSLIPSTVIMGGSSVYDATYEAPEDYMAVISGERAPKYKAVFNKSTRLFEPKRVDKLGAWSVSNLLGSIADGIICGWAHLPIEIQDGVVKFLQRGTYEIMISMLGDEMPKVSSTGSVSISSLNSNTHMGQDYSIRGFVDVERDDTIQLAGEPQDGLPLTLSYAAFSVFKAAAWILPHVLPYIFRPRCVEPLMDGLADDLSNMLVIAKHDPTKIDKKKMALVASALKKLKDPAYVQNLFQGFTHIRCDQTTHDQEYLCKGTSDPTVEDGNLALSINPTTGALEPTYGDYFCVFDYKAVSGNPHVINDGTDTYTHFNSVAASEYVISYGIVEARSTTFIPKLSANSLDTNAYDPKIYMAPVKAYAP
jgi:hypothetical protein